MSTKEKLKNYIEGVENLYKNIHFLPNTPDLMEKVNAYIGENITENSFRVVLFKFMEEKNVSQKEIYKRVNLDRRLFYKIKNEDNYHPSRETVILFGLALHLTYSEFDILYASASYILSDHRREDLIIKYFFINNIYDINTINECLYDYGFETLN